MLKGCISFDGNREIQLTIDLQFIAPGKHGHLGENNELRGIGNLTTAEYLKV